MTEEESDRVKDKWKCWGCGGEFEIERPEKPVMCPNPNCNKKNNFEALTGPWRFFKGKKFVPMRLASNIMEDYHFATNEESGTLFSYNDGIYEEKGKVIAEREAQKRLGNLSKSHYVNETVDAIRRDNFTPTEKFGNPEHEIIVENGILDLETRELKDHTPEVIHLSKIPVKYDPEAECPKIKNFISALVYEEDIKLIQEMFGYCLLKDYPIAKAFMLLGSGANGKSTLLDLLTRFLGEDNVCSPSLQELLDNRFKKIELYGKLANIHADLSNSELENTGTFKMLTGGDKIMGEKKRKDPIEFYNHAKLIYSANELPKTSDRTLAFFRRWIIIEFPNQFLEGDEETETNLPDSIVDEGEMSGLLNWALDGLDRILENGQFTKSKTREDIEQEWIRQTDSLRAFLEDCITVKSDHKIAKPMFYQLYHKYCGKHDIYRMKKGQVTKSLPSKIPQTEIYKPEIDGKQIRCWRNLDVKKDALENKSFIKKAFHEMINDSNRQDRQAFSTYFDRESESIINQKDSEKTLSMLSQVKKIRDIVENKDLSRDELIEYLVENEDIEREKAQTHVDKLIEEGELIESVSSGALEWGNGYGF